MRVAVNTRFLRPGELEGIGYFTREICRRLPELLPAAEWLYCFDRPFDPVLTADPRVTGRAIFPPARDPILWKLWFDYALPRAVRAWEADVVLHLDGYCSLRTSVPQVMVTHDIAHVHYPNEIPRRARAYYRRTVPRFLDRAARILTVSEYVRGDIQRVYGVPGEKIALTCNGVRPEFRPLSAEERTRARDDFADGSAYFFYLGAIHPRKNVARLIRAYNGFRAGGGPPVRLVLGGRMAWQTGAIERAYADSPFRSDIVFLGYLPEDALVRALGGALALVYPSLSEGFGVPLLEAMHAGVPIVTSNTSSLPEVAGSAAVFVDPRRESSITEGLTRIAEDPALAASLVAAGHARKDVYSWDRAAAAVAEQLAAVAGGVGPGA
ncbi:glycosyltransferase family 4 protein [Lewinella sp. IMCC34183]|uniref:glycosyltransferase family 4 protein n=1 Tax=Lewinella sp. IMCC34183 TaxID=2248762 RepID=UPI000E24DD99|nr:glycosyltransferase family 1 protein [Lewinella sp. IMCC34183]